MDAIKKLEQGGTNTRIMSGDHKDTVIWWARKFYLIEQDLEDGVMSGEELRQRLNELLVYTESEDDKKTKRYRFKNKESRTKFI
jgi:magnesium-transporting ATPase (P-type)